MQWWTFNCGAKYWIEIMNWPKLEWNTFLNIRTNIGFDNCLTSLALLDEHGAWTNPSWRQSVCKWISRTRRILVIVDCTSGIAKIDTLDCRAMHACEGVSLDIDCMRWVGQGVGGQCMCRLDQSYVSQEIELNWLWQSGYRISHWEGGLGDLPRLCPLSFCCPSRVHPCVLLPHNIKNTSQWISGQNSGANYGLCGAVIYRQGKPQHIELILYCWLGLCYAFVNNVSKWMFTLHRVCNNVQMFGFCISQSKLLDQDESLWNWIKLIWPPLYTNVHNSKSLITDSILPQI